METFQLYFELIGAVAFAISGAALGIRKGMDLFGVAMVGMTTAVGGGILRDVMLGQTPPAALRDPAQALVAIAVSVLCFYIWRWRKTELHNRYADAVLLVADSIGLGIFSAHGAAIAIQAGYRRKSGASGGKTACDRRHIVVYYIIQKARREVDAMGLHDGHRQRAKERYGQVGADALADHELLELALFYAVPRQDTNETAHRLLKRFRSLQGVLQASPEELEQVEGVGKNAALLLHLMADISQRARITSLPEKILNSPDRTGAYFMELLTGQKRELLYQVCLDGKGKLLTCRCIAKGTVSASAVHVRQVVENALYAGASTIILAHNHPSGVALPSDADVLVTHRIQEALAPLGIRLADHIIVADDDYVSMAESGFLQR